MADAVPRFERKTAFRVAKSGASQLVTSGSEVTVDFTDVIYDLGNNFDLTTDRYTAPLDGIYVFTAGVQLVSAAAGAGRVLARVNTNVVEVIRGEDKTVRDFGAGDANAFTLAGQTHLSQGDQVRLLLFVVSGPNQTITPSSITVVHFEGFRIQSESRTILGG